MEGEGKLTPAQVKAVVKDIYIDGRLYLLSRSPESLLLFEAWESGVPSSAPPLSPVAREYGNATSVFHHHSWEPPLVFFAALIQYRTHMGAQKRLYTQPNGRINQVH